MANRAPAYMTPKASRNPRPAAFDFIAHPINPRTGSPWTLVDPELWCRVEPIVKDASSSPEKALAFLKRIGIATSTGKLAKKYGGD